ncbi:cyclic AMP-dependent transcription factor ATF-4-like [Varroa destructor]|uniref:BZIP domain-containing protein n=1 Tax=Varroa destructor TaxID=109461 RepID=A0A7M7KWF6_VARDE|nr:cyclic AMP-dependent transcription factor ATF-4-like [Varroa destructor]
MLSAVPAFRDSKLEAFASSLGPTIATSEALVDGQITNNDSLQFAASFLHEPDYAGHLLDLIGSACNSGFDHLPLIDESAFDLVGIPELEDIKGQSNECADTDLAPPACQPLFDEIPALEEVSDEEVSWPPWASEFPSDAVTPVAPLVKLEQEDDRLTACSDQISSSIQVISPKVVFEDDSLRVSGYEEEVQALSPNTKRPSAYAESSVGCASPASVYSLGYCTSSSSGIGGSSPFSSGFTSADEMTVQSPIEKKRRTSQVSVSSFCTSIGGTDSIGSPASSTSGTASDNDHSTEQKIRVTKAGTGGGRRSRFSPEDRKERKKAQNRTAAERYRQKRRQAEETITEEEQQLMDANGELRTEVTKLEAEVSCLKRLMREMLQAKGIEIPVPLSTKKSKTSA